MSVKESAINLVQQKIKKHQNFIDETRKKINKDYPWIEKYDLNDVVLKTESFVKDLREMEKVIEINKS
jgi:hypothetical protein